MVKRYNYKNPKPAQWHEGPRYDISVANNLLYTNSDWTRGRSRSSSRTSGTATRSTSAPAMPG